MSPRRAAALRAFAESGGQERDPILEEPQELHLPPRCPECKVGKHGNCDGTTWCPVCDERVECPCSEGAHLRNPEAAVR